jgi:DNA polymerase lambda
LEGVWGLGPRGAEKLYAKGIKSIEDLRKNEDQLTSMQKIGLKYYEDFKERIPREEVEQLLEKFRKSAYQEVKGGEEVMSVEACGSFRRGRPTCGDIDILITLKNGTNIKGLCEKLVIKLEKEGFLKERLGDFRRSTTGSEGYMGVCQLDAKHKFRRIDIKVYPRDQYGFALLYFTGSDKFNIKMR